jgi:hypothetical protein
MTFLQRFLECELCQPIVGKYFDEKTVNFTFDNRRHEEEEDMTDAIQHTLINVFVRANLYFNRRKGS